MLRITNVRWASRSARLLHSQADMSKRFVSRMRLCLSGSTDYWVNDRLGQPFMEELAADSQLHRYMLVFDRECYSIDFFKYLKERNIAFCTYRKNVKEKWPDECFSDYEVVGENGDRETMRLAEATTALYGSKDSSC